MEFGYIYKISINMDIKPLNTFTNVGDTLSSINFNFTCLDIKLCNLQHASIKYNEVSEGTDWFSSFTETLAMSSNWESVKKHVHSASAYWDQRVCTIFYPNVFPEGRASLNTIYNWLRSNFPASNYRDGQIFIIYFLEWYKDPALHNPSSKSLSRFGKLTKENNVYVKKISNASYTLKNNNWVYTINTHFPKSCVEESCNSCWGEKYYPDHPLCYQEPIYYMLSCPGIDEPAPEDEDPCVLLTQSIDYSYYPTINALQTNDVFIELSATNLVPYSIGFSYNPHLDEVGVVGGDIYRKYIWESSEPVLDNILVERLSGFALQHNYTYIASANEFVNNGTFSSTDAFDFSLSSNIDFPFNFSDSTLRKYMKANGQINLISPRTSACPFRIQVDSIWYRWVANTTSLSGDPYWHISNEPGSALGFNYQPEAGVPDSASIWLSAEDVLGDTLSSYFGTYYDMMGAIDDIKVFAL